MTNIFFVLLNSLKKNSRSEASRHARKSWKQKAPSFSFSKLMLFLTLLFLFIPLVVVIVNSFNASKGAKFTNFSFVWYKELIFNSRPLWQSLLNSVIVALTSALVATLLGSLAAIGCSWYKFFGKKFVESVTYLPMVIPEVIVGIATLIFFSGIKLPLGLFTIFAAHTTFCLPFVYLVVKARLDEFDFSIIEAAHDLGATEMQTLVKVIIPSLLPGILSGFLMAVTMSLEDFVITFFVAGPGSTTLPLYVYSMIRFGVSPVINALSCVMILFTCLIAFVLRGALKAVAASH